MTIPGNGVITLGETMALMDQQGIGDLFHSPSFTLSIGGAESNVAIALARLGIPVRWIGRVGADGFGALIARELRAEGVDARIIEDDAAATGLMVKERGTGELIRVRYYRDGSAGSRLRSRDLAASDLAGAGILHVTGITVAVSDSARLAVRAAIDAARVAGVAVSFDVNYRSRLWRDRDAAAILTEFARLADVLFVSSEEAGLLAPGIYRRPRGRSNFRRSAQPRLSSPRVATDAMCWPMALIGIFPRWLLTSLTQLGPATDSWRAISRSAWLTLPWPTESPRHWMLRHLPA